MGLRADDPVAMKDFVLSVQHRHEELKADATQSGIIFSSGKRVSFYRCEFGSHDVVLYMIVENFRCNRFKVQKII